MNTEAFNAGKAAYQQGNLVEAVSQLVAAKQPGEVSGQIDHLLGNCYMRLGRYDEAATCYADALHDSSYGQSGALACNRGRALMAAGKPQEAIASLTMATKDASYATPYKAYLALGSAYQALGDARNAGVAFRNAAIDEGNPRPAGALTKLGDCFMKMGRAVDAIEAYRTGLDFATPADDQNAIYASMGLAYVAANRLPEAADAFGRAAADGTYQLSPEERAASEAANKALAAKSNGPSETDALLAAAGYGTAAGVDPLDPLGKSGEFMPSPEDTGFFSVSEEDLVAQDKKARKVHRKKKHTGLKVFIIFLILIILIGGGGAFAYYKGYGWPTAESVSSDLFTTASNGDDVSSFFSGAVSSSTREQIQATLPTNVASTEVKGVDRSMQECTVLLAVTFNDKGTQSYKVSLVRDGLSWKVAGVQSVYASLDGQTASLGSASTSSSSADSSASQGSADTSTDTTSSDNGTDTSTTSTDSTN